MNEIDRTEKIDIEGFTKGLDPRSVETGMGRNSGVRKKNVHASIFFGNFFNGLIDFLFGTNIRPNVNQIGKKRFFCFKSAGGVLERLISLQSI